jgi:hypothetical protein
MNKNEYVASLRELADFVESREFPDKWEGAYDENNFDSPRLIFWARNKNDFGLIASAMGSFKKESNGDYIGAKKILPAGAYITLDANKNNTCTKKVVGTKIVPFKEAELVPAVPEHEEEIVEWECPESFVALKEEVNAI